MDRGPIQGPSLSLLRQELHKFPLTSGETPVGMDKQGRIVTAEQAGSTFEECRKKLVDYLLGERKPKFKQLKEHQITVSIPDEITVSSLREAIKGFDRLLMPEEPPSEVVHRQPVLSLGSTASEVQASKQLHALQSSSYSSMQHFHNAFQILEKIQNVLQDELDHPDMIKAAKDIATKMASRSMKARLDLRPFIANLSKLPDSKFKRTLQQPLTPLWFDLAQKYQLNQEQIPVLQKHLNQFQDTTAVETALMAWRHLNQQDVPFPFDFILAGLARNPDQAKRIADHTPGADPALDRKVGEPFLRKCVLDFVGFPNITQESERYITSINVWHDPTLLEQVAPLKKLNAAYAAINGRPMSTDLLLCSLSDSRLKAASAVSIINKLPEPEVLTERQQQAAQIPTVRVIADSIDKSAQRPSTKALKAFHDVVRFASGQMKQEEYEDKQKSIDNAINAVSYSWLPVYLDDSSGLLFNFINSTFHDKSYCSELVTHLRQWYAADQQGRGSDYLNRLQPDTLQDFLQIYNNLAIANLQSHLQDLPKLEPLISAVTTIDSFDRKMQLGHKFMSFAYQDRLAERFKEIGLRPGQRTTPDGNCGFAAIAMLTGDSPTVVREKARQVALDMQDYMDHKNLERINGDFAYKSRIKTAVESYNEKSFIEDLQSPGTRAQFVGTDPNTINFPQVPTEPKHHLENYWLHDEDMQYLAVAYNRAFIPFAEINPIGRHIAKYITPEGELKYCMEDQTYLDGLKLLDGMPRPLALVNMGAYAFAHWMPMIPAPKPRRHSPPASVPPLTENEMMTSLRGYRLQQQEQLAHFRQNPELIPEGQNFMPRLDESAASNDSPHSSATASRNQASHKSSKLNQAAAQSKQLPPIQSQRIKGCMDLEAILDHIRPGEPCIVALDMDDTLIAKGADETRPHQRGLLNKRTKELLDAIRKKAGGDNARIILLSANEWESLERKAKEADKSFLDWFDEKISVQVATGPVFSKGQGLTEYLQKSRHPARHIIFADDSEPFLENVETTCNQLDIPCTSIHYRGALELQIKVDYELQTMKDIDPAYNAYEDLTFEKFRQIRLEADLKGWSADEIRYVMVENSPAEQRKLKQQGINWKEEWRKPRT